MAAGAALGLAAVVGVIGIAGAGSAQAAKLGTVSFTLAPGENEAAKAWSLCMASYPQTDSIEFAHSSAGAGGVALRTWRCFDNS